MRRLAALVLPVALSCAPPTVKPPPATESIHGGAENGEGTADDGMHGALHKANQGKILFSATRLADDAPEDVATIKEITLGDQVYAKGFFARSASQQLHRESAACGPSASGWLERSFSIDGRPVASIGDPVATSADYEKHTTAIVDLGGIDPTRPVVWPGFRRELPLAWELANLDDGTHTVDVSFGARCRAPTGRNDPIAVLATGSISIKVNAKVRAAFAAAVGPFLEPNVFKSAADTKVIVAAAQKQYPAMFVDFRGLEEQWKVTSEGDVPVMRVLPAIVTIRNPPQCTVQGVRIVEDWISGKWSVPHFENEKDTKLDPQPIACVITQAKLPKAK